MPRTGSPTPSRSRPKIPQRDRELEFLIKTDLGPMGDALPGASRERAWTVAGRSDRFAFRTPARATPAVHRGGTGVAPIRSMIRHALATATADASVCSTARGHRTTSRTAGAERVSRGGEIDLKLTATREFEGGGGAGAAASPPSSSSRSSTTPTPGVSCAGLQRWWRNSTGSATWAHQGASTSKSGARDPTGRGRRGPGQGPLPSPRPLMCLTVDLQGGLHVGDAAYLAREADGLLLLFLALHAPRERHHAPERIDVDA
jgi:hypothetical protein